MAVPKPKKDPRPARAPLRVGAMTMTGCSRCSSERVAPSLLGLDDLEGDRITQECAQGRLDEAGVQSPTVRPRWRPIVQASLLNSLRKTAHKTVDQDKRRCCWGSGGIPRMLGHGFIFMQAITYWDVGEQVALLLVRIRFDICGWQKWNRSAAPER